MRDITFNGWHLPTLAKATKLAGSPTEGGLAHLVWNLSNYTGLPLDDAREFMEEAGYLSFAGYPLTRLNG